MISSEDSDAYNEAYVRFQSRNRGSFDFKLQDVETQAHRDAGFNLVIEVLLISREDEDGEARVSPICFNLVIEVLLISSELKNAYPNTAHIQFQSRNRGSFDFKAGEPSYQNKN